MTAIQTAIAPPLTMTYEEFLAWADEDTNAEWVNGKVVWMSHESNKHQEVTGFLYTLISLYVQHRNLGVVRFERFQMKTAPNLPGREPDVLFVSTANLSRLKNTYLDGPADLAIEVVSLESRERDRGAKFYEYEQGGVPEYWLIDPARQRAEFYQRGTDGLYQLSPADEQVHYRSLTLPGFRFQVDWLWQDPLPSVLDILKQWNVISFP